MFTIIQYATYYEEEIVFKLTSCIAVLETGVVM